jgi:RIO-like serine/threonine protein kinase
MSLIDKAAAQLDAADLIILANVETIRDQQQPATANAVASLIGGARGEAIYYRLRKATSLGLLEPISLDLSRYQLTAMGAELLSREMIGWSPSNREQRRRDTQLRSAIAGAWK